MALPPLAPPTNPTFSHYPAAGVALTASAGFRSLSGEWLILTAGWVSLAVLAGRLKPPAEPTRP